MRKKKDIQNPNEDIKSIKPINEKIIFCSGISGSERKGYLSEVEEYSDHLGKKVKVYDLENYIKRISEERDFTFSKDRFLNRTPDYRAAIRAAAFEVMLKDIDKDINKNSTANFTAIVTSHACFYWKHHFSLAFDFSYFDALNPDIYLTVIHSVIKIKANLNCTSKVKHTDAELLNWQDAERLTTEVMAQSQKKPFYILARNQPPSTLYDLIFNQDKMKVYLSYPMSFADDETLIKVQNFKKRLSRYAVVFDPGSIEEIKDIENVEADAKEIVEMQTVSRDFRLIEQSDRIVVYFPGVIHSSGVVSEYCHASRIEKEVMVVFPSERISPFTSYHADSIFKSEDKFFEFLEKEEKKLKNEQKNEEKRKKEEEESKNRNIIK